MNESNILQQAKERYESEKLVSIKQAHERIEKLYERIEDLEKLVRECKCQPKK